MGLVERLRQFNRLLHGYNASTSTAEDTYALHLISGLLQSGPYIPLNKMSMRPYALAFIINEIIINRRKTIIEFGSGISTFLLARMIKTLKLDTTFYSVDEDENWAQLVSDHLAAEGANTNVRLILNPLEKRQSPHGQPHWYNQVLLEEQIGNTVFDAVLVDGPTAYNKEIEYSRYFAMPFVQKRLAANNVIFLDDASREGEKKILRDWSQQFGIPFSIYAGSLGVGYTGEHFEANPLRNVTILPA